MDINLSRVERDGFAYNTFNYDGAYFEVPTSIDYKQAIEDHWVQKQIALASSLDMIVDDVYMNGAVKRQDFSVSTEQGAALVSELEEHWNNFDFTKYPINIAGKFEAHRPPYQNTSISWYNFERPSAELLSDYGLTIDSYTYVPWYGLKFDLVTKEILLKVVIEDSSIPDSQRPPLPSSMKFFARIYHPDGSVDPMIDCYVYASPHTMQNYCDSVGIQYPLPDSSEESNCWIWGIVYNAENLEVTHVKAYIRHS